MADRFSTLPVADLVARWEKLPPLCRADAYGYMMMAVDQARVAVEMAEKFAAREAQADRTASLKRMRVIAGGRRV